MNTKRMKTLCIIFAALLLLLVGCTPANSEQQKELDSLKQQVEDLTKESGTLKQQVEDLTKESGTLKQQVEDLTKENGTLKQENEALKQQVADYGQFKLYKNIISQDEVEQTLFGQPISTERNGEYRIGIKTAIDGDYHATLTIYQAQDGKYVEVFSCEALVGKNGPGKQSEGDVKTPLGTWTIGEAYGIKEDPGSLLPYTQVTDDMYWCATGSNGLNYNTLLYKSEHPDWDYSEDEHLMDYPIRYAYFLDLGYNAAGAPYAGNAIFLHCWKEPDYPTGGCVAVSEESMIKILQTVTPGTSVTIY